MTSHELISAFDAFLVQRGVRLDAVVIGGMALNLLGVTARATRDCDVLEPPLSKAVMEAAHAFAHAERARGEALDDGWLNAGPASLAAHLPEGWRERLQPLYEGSSIRLECLGRDDLLRSKLWAVCDRALDLPDCVALAPSAEELARILPWLEQQDLHPDWPGHVHEVLADVGKRLGHGV
jgi:hypothetical protein